MESIRRGVFETNSSSTHSLTMCSESEYEKWKKGELFFARWNENFLTKDKILEIAKARQQDYLKEKEEGKTLYHIQEQYINAQTDEELFKLECEKEDYMTYDEFWDYFDSEYSTFEESYATKSGETIISFGYYGYDG